MERDEYITQMRTEIKEQSDKEGTRDQVRYLAKCLDSWIQEDDLAERYQNGKWTLEDLWKAIIEKAKRKAKSNSYACCDDEVEGWVKDILKGDNRKEEPKKEHDNAQEETEDGEKEEIPSKPTKRSDKPRKDGFEQIALFDL